MESKDLRINILQMFRDPETGGVTTISWEAVGEHCTFPVNTGFSPNASSPDFVPFEKVTPELAEKWVKDALTENDLAQIEGELSPRATVKAGLPWEKGE